MRTEIGIDVAAPPAVVFELARDVTRWPERLPHYRRVTVQRRQAGRLLARMVAVRQIGRLPVPVSWGAECWAEGDDPGDLRLRFLHVRGFTRGMDVTWHIRPAAAGSRVTIEHEFSRSLPLVGAEVLPALVDRFFVRPIAGRTLATFKALAERQARARKQAA
jgi:ribosome-associated toxin RatA of RatAB toxin-antitoxin module